MPIKVGASDVSQSIPSFTATAGALELTDVQLLAKHFTDDLEALSGETFEVVYAGLGDAAAVAALDLDGKIALMERGEIAFDEKVRNAKAAGAAAAIVYNNEAGQIPHYIGENTAYLPAFRLSQADGEALKTAVESGKELTFGALGNVQSEGDHLADFSSRGPVEGTYDIKPDVTAPGVAIYSTVPAFINDPETENYDIAYARMQGTSMASPHVAGVAALILQEHPDYTPFDVKAALMNTSVDMQADYSVYEVGAGRILAYAAVHASTYIKVPDQTEMVDGEEVITLDTEKGALVFGSFYFEDDAAIEAEKTMTIGNRADEAQSYQLEAEFLPARDQRQDAAENGVALNMDAALTLPAGETADVELSMHVPNDAAHGFYEGYVRVVNENNSDEAYQVPFAIRVTDKGIDFMNVTRHALTNDSTFHSFLLPFIGMEFRLKSPMESVDVIVTDGETDEAIGYVGSLNASALVPDKTLYVIQAFNGKIQLFTDNPEQPIADEVTTLPEGNYHLKLIGADDAGKQYVLKEFVIIDNTPAEITYNDVEPGIIEVDESMYTEEDGHHALWVHTNVYDSTIDVLKERGLDYDQSSNQVAYYQNSPFPGLLPVEADGLMKFGVLPEEVEAGPVDLGLEAIDLATNVTERIWYTFVEAGTAYGEAVYQEEEVRLGDTVTFTLNLNNVEELVAGNFDLRYTKEIYQLKDVQLNDAFADYLAENDLTATIDEPTIDEELWDNIVHVGASINEADAAGFTGDIPFIDVTFDVVADTIFGGKSQVHYDAINEFSYEQAGGTEALNIPVFAHEQHGFISKHSIVYGHIKPEAFLHPDGFVTNQDYEALGVKITAKGPDGKVYEGTVDRGAQYQIKGLPVSEEPYEIKVEVPGHLTSVAQVQLGEEIDGELFGENVRVNTPMNLAGDINGDGVIDIMDVMRIVAKYEKEDDATDINKDGIVDEIDIRLIETNFLEVGPGVNKQPVEKLGKKGLADFLEALGLEPAE